MASPQWTRGDCENIARYIFEKTKTPALSLLHSGIACQYGLKHQTVTVVDIGFEKVDVTCISDNLIVSQKSLGFPSPSREISGGEIFTQKLLSLLKDKGFTYDMAEQLKKSSLCEVLPYAPDSPDFMELPTDADAPQVLEPDAAAALAEMDETDAEVAKEGEDGVLDVANIVTSGNAREFLAKKEKEKAEKAKAKKNAKGQEAEAAAAAAAIRLPNSKKRFTVFHYEELVHEDVQVPASSDGTATAEEANPNATVTSNPDPTNGEAPASAADAEAPPPPTGEVKPEEAKDDVSQPQPPAPAAASASAPASAEPAPKTNGNLTTERRTKRVQKDIEVGPERFQFADRGEIDRIVAAIYHAVQGIDEPYRRPACWDSLVFVGNGSRLKGLRENILQTLHARHLVSPSSATIFSSELPSNMATPSGTGSQTPTGSGPYAGVGGQLALPSAGGVNPLLQAATTASSLGVPGQVAQQQQQTATVSTPGGTSGGDITMGGVGNVGGPGSLQLQQQHHSSSSNLLNQHHGHGQTPTSIKLATLPTYLAEWTKNGFEEAMFLGALVFGRLVFCHNNVDAEALRMLSLTRVDYNELGPKAVRTHSCMP
ncbi:Actin-like protein arp9 [Diatrype stigma]|uniref:Actin-like protein arp9 n=1 Tax=Diatrype stigma TaxID=117547 RepID=A0AAN9UDZ4_9PEZI